MPHYKIMGHFLFYKPYHENKPNILVSQNHKQLFVKAVLEKLGKMGLLKYICF